MKDEVVRDACVMPRTSGSAVAGERPLGHGLLVFGLELGLVDLFAHEEARSARLGDGHLAEHLAHDDFDVLVVDAHALEAVHFLDFVHQVGGEVLLALGAQDVVQLGVAFGQQVAALDEVAVGHGDVLALGHQVFLGFAHFRRDDELALALGFAREGNGARDFGNHGHILGLADFEQLGDSRKTTHDVAGLGGFTRLTGDDVAREHLLAVLDHDDRADGEAVDRGELARARAAWDRRFHRRRRRTGGSSSYGIR